MDSVGEGEGGKIWENGIETCIISCMKRVASPGSMHDTGCLGLVHWDGSNSWSPDRSCLDRSRPPPDQALGTSRWCARAASAPLLRLQPTTLLVKPCPVPETGSARLLLCSEPFSASLWPGGYRLLTVEAQRCCPHSPVPCTLEQAVHSSQVQPASAPPLVLLPRPLPCQSTSLPRG